MLQKPDGSLMLALHLPVVDPGVGGLLSPTPLVNES